MISKVKDVVLRDELQNGGVLEIWDVLDIDITINYEDAIAHNLQPGDPRWINNELAKPSRTAYLDGHAVVRTDAEQAFFQESFVHPALMALENPRMIAILGGPGSILYEILKCHTIESVTWLQPNEQLIQTIQEFIPQTFDCSDLQGRPDSCLEEGSTAPLKWVKQDAKDYFGGNNIANDNSVFDVIFSQLVKPHNADDLTSYVESVMKEGLSPDGALMLSLGQAPTVLHPRGDIGHFASYENLFRTLEGLDEVDSMTVFEEDFTLSGFTNEIVPETFLLVCKSAKCLERFHSKPEMIDLQLTGRYLSRLSNKPILEYYDGAVHSRMQVPPKAYETIYCRREPMPIECAYRSLDFSHSMYEFDASDLTRSAFEVLKEEEEDVRVVATVDIPEGSYIMAKDLSQSLLVSEASLGRVLSDDDGADSLASAGRVSLHGGSARSRVLEMGVPGLILTTETAEASNVGCWFCPQQSQRPKYSPVYDRHFGSFDSFLVATKAIAKGEELVRLLV
ncbi:unnamed protein product [Cylindrotheca closterium]|uniref:Uncharacterized protein n=1 Tax=Cylindrotheca closterium TaxID=2856 RepID=A0AAD2CQN5_9STRA|nr:unnamed protein product [Cylindrotheca closterium]